MKITYRDDIRWYYIDGFDDRRSLRWKDCSCQQGLMLCLDTPTAGQVPVFTNGVYSLTNCAWTPQPSWMAVAGHHCAVGGAAPAHPLCQLTLNLSRNVLSQGVWGECPGGVEDTHSGFGKCDNSVRKLRTETE